MKKIIFNTIRFFAVFFLSWLIIPSAFCQENKPNVGMALSLPEAITVAFKNNRDIQIQEKEVEVAKANILGAKSKFLPKVNLDAGYTHNDKVLTQSIFSGYNNDNTAGVSVDQSIYSGGGNLANLKQSEVKLTIQQESLRARKLDIEFEVKRLYYGLLLAYQTEQITGDLVNQAQAHYEEVKSKFQEGTASKFDVLQSKVQVSKLVPEFIKAKNAVYLISAELKKLLGMKLFDSLVLKDTLSYSFIEINEPEFLKRAYLNKPEMVLKALGVDVGKWQVAIAKSSGRPQINANFDYTYRSNNLENLLNEKHNNWNTGISVTIPIFDGFSTKAKVDEAKAKYAQANLEKEDLGEQISVDIRRACLDLDQQQSIIDSTKDSIEEAKQALKIAEISYDNGEATNLEIMDAQVSLGQVEKNFSEATYDYIMAKAFLDRTMGEGSLKGEK